MTEEYKPDASHLVPGMVTLAGVFAEALEAEHIGLRGRLEEVASRELRRFQDQQEDHDVVVILMMFLQKLHAQSLERKT